MKNLERVGISSSVVSAMDIQSAVFLRCSLRRNLLCLKQPCRKPVQNFKRLQALITSDVNASQKKKKVFKKLMDLIRYAHFEIKLNKRRKSR